MRCLARSSPALTPVRSLPWTPACHFLRSRFGAARTPQGSEGARFHPDLKVPAEATVVRKGFRQSIDSYSAFRDNDHRSGTGLADALRELGVRRAVIVGLAYDFCVTYTAVDAIEVAGLESVALVRNATRSVGLPGTVEAADKSNAEAGVLVV